MKKTNMINVGVGTILMSVVCPPVATGMLIVKAAKAAKANKVKAEEEPKTEDKNLVEVVENNVNDVVVSEIKEVNEG